MSTNRIAPVGLWPTDPLKAIERADRDLDFVDVIEELGFNIDPSLLQIKSRALAKRVAAQERLTQHPDP